MSYPRNAATPPIVAVGAIYLLADGTIQTTGASVRVKTGTGSWGSGAGTLACDSTSGIWTYAPTQGETDAESFVIGVYKSASTSAQVTVATSASATAGYSGVDWGKLTAATTTVNLSGTTISTTQAVASVSGAVGSVTGAVGSVTGAVGSVTGAVGSVTARVTANTDQWGGVTVTGMPLPTTSYTAPPTAATNATAVRTELATELARIDTTISSRLPTASYTTPPTVAQVVTGVYAALPADHTVSGSYGVRFLLALNTNRIVQVTGSNHIAADVHEFQTDVIDADAIAASAVTEIQAGLATAANLLIVSDRVSYSLTILAGACSDAQTAAETYTLSIGGNTFTVDYTGLDSSGNRSTTTLSKT